MEERGQMQISKEVVGSVHGCGTFGSTGDSNLTCGWTCGSTRRLAKRDEDLGATLKAT